MSCDITLVGVTGFEPATSSSRSTLMALGSGLVSTMNVLASPGTSRSLHRDCHSVSHSAWTGYARCPVLPNRVRRVSP
jgi:hypothetical protein